MKYTQMKTKWANVNNDKYYQKNLLFCILRDWKDIVYYKLLQPNQPMTSDMYYSWWIGQASNWLAAPSISQMK